MSDPTEQHSGGAGKHILAIDHGTSGCKTALVSVDGRVVGFEFEPVVTHYRDGGVAEQDPEEWWRALVTAGRRLVDRGLVAKDDIVAVGCSSTFSTTVAVDAAGQHLGPALTWLDARGAAHVQRAMSGLVNIEGYGLTTLLLWVTRSGGGPTLSGKDDIAHVLYWKHEEPDTYRRTAAFLGSKDYLNLRLTGQVAASFDSMSLFWVTDNRDAYRIRYDDALISRLGVDRAKLPPMRASSEVLGPLRDEVADALGLRRGTPVSVGSPDLQSACIGAGAVRDFEPHIYVGTSSWILAHVPFKKTDVLHKIASLPSAIPGRWFCANEQDMAGGCLEFLARNVLFHRNRLRDEAPPKDVYARLDEIVATVPAGSRGVLFTPWLNGEKTPVDDERLRGGFHNLSVSTTVDDMCRAVYEGVAMNSRWSFGYVEKFLGRRVDSLAIIGGGARSDIWCQIFADVLDRTIRRVEDPLAANARGAAWIAAVALGLITFDDIPALVRHSGTFTPRPVDRRLHDERYREFLALHERNRPIYHRLNRP